MTSPDWLDELDLHAGPPEAAMGTRALDPTRWLLPDDAQRDEARHLLVHRRGDVLVSASSDRDATEELDARIVGVLGVDDRLSDEPLARARWRVAEDLCLLTPARDGTWVLSSGAVCFPSYWRLGEKVGRPLADVHGPVPGYPGPLADRVDGFLGRLRPGQGVWRRNWSIHDGPELFLPEHGRPAESSDRWLRSEYQTLVRLEHAEAVVFTIRTQQVPLTDLVDRPDVCAGLAAAVRAWTPAQRAYKGSAVDDGVLTWLDAPVHRDG